MEIHDVKKKIQIARLEAYQCKTLYFHFTTGHLDMVLSLADGILLSFPCVF